LTYLGEWARAFALTQIIEVPLVVVATRPLAMPAWQRAALAAFASLATHPIVWFVMPELGLSEPARYVGSELWAFGAEALFYRLALPGASWGRAAAASGLANAVSFGVGVVFHHLIGA
jgi:hypothetical protein